jgi:hypothetical protein
MFMAWGYSTYLRKDTELSAVFNATMTTSSSRLGSALLKHYDFFDMRKIVDVGGGHGLTLAMILNANPTVHGVLYDLPDVVAGAGQNFDAAGVRERCEIVGGFFDSIPKDADGYVLKQIIHDLDDDQSLTILRNCRAAMPNKSKLLLIERADRAGSS